MDSRFETTESYWDASRRVRETWARQMLGDVLHWAFSGLLEATPDDALDGAVRYTLGDTIRAIEPAWAPVGDTLAGMPVKALRTELQDAFTRIRAIAHAVATLQPTAMVPMTVHLYIPHPASDREGRPWWRLRGRLSDALVWCAFKLLAEVPRSLIRSCALTGCSTIYVGAKNQRYCPPHQAEAQRQTQRRAEHAFRERAAKKKRRKRR